MTSFWRVCQVTKYCLPLWRAGVESLVTRYWSLELLQDLLSLGELFVHQSQSWFRSLAAVIPGNYRLALAFVYDICNVSVEASCWFFVGFASTVARWSFLAADAHRMHGVDLGFWHISLTRVLVYLFLKYIHDHVSVILLVLHWLFFLLHYWLWLRNLHLNLDWCRFFLNQLWL